MTTRAEAAENKQLQERAKYLRELLKEFGLNLCGFDPGVSAYWDAHPELRPSAWNGPINLDQNEWRWIEPLLIELRDRRRGTYNTPDADSVPREFRKPKKRR